MEEFKCGLCNAIFKKKTGYTKHLKTKKHLKNSQGVDDIVDGINNINITKVTNRGTGAGGSNTNKNGLRYEDLTNLNDVLNTLKKNKFSSIITFNGKDKKFIKTQKKSFLKCMKDYVDTNVISAHGCKEPDECYIDEELKNIFIIEKKFQQCSGSTCEKVQTSDFKLWQYNRIFPDYNIVYIYCLSDWFRQNCKAEVEYLEYRKVPFFWGSDKKYKEDIVSYIINYK